MLEQFPSIHGRYITEMPITNWASGKPEEIIIPGVCVYVAGAEKETQNGIHLGPLRFGINCDRSDSGYPYHRDNRHPDPTDADWLEYWLGREYVNNTHCIYIAGTIQEVLRVALFHLENHPRKAIDVIGRTVNERPRELVFP